jgi:hypothetical protein
MPRLINTKDERENHRLHGCDGEERSNDPGCNPVKSMRRVHGLGGEGSNADACDDYGLYPRVRDDPRHGKITSQSR